MGNPAADRLALAHQRSLLALSAGVTSYTTSVALGADPAAIDVWYFAVVDSLISQVQAGHGTARRMSTEFLSKHARLNGVDLTPSPASLDLGRARTSLRVTGPVAFKQAIAAGMNESEAVRTMATRMSGASQRLVLAGDRDTTQQTIAQSKGAVGYRRRLSGRSCGFCAMLASRGAVYWSAKTALVAKDGMRFHDHCDCWAEPMYPGQQETAEVRLLQRQWQRITSGLSGKAARSEWRRHWESVVPRERQAAAGVKPRAAAATPSPTPLTGAVEPGQAFVIRESLASASSLQDLESAFATEAQRITGKRLPARFGRDADLDVAKEHAEGVLLALERYPDAKFTGIDSIDTTFGAPIRGRDNIYAQTWNDGEIQFNLRWARSRQDYLDALGRDSAQGWAVRNAGTPGAIAIHEFGHVLDMATLGEVVAPRAVRLAEQLAKRAGLSTEDFIRREVSGYATSSADELVAEAFLDAMVNGPRASELSRGILAMIDAEYARGGRSLVREVSAPRRAAAARTQGVPLTAEARRKLAQERGMEISPTARDADVGHALELDLDPAARPAIRTGNKYPGFDESQARTFRPQPEEKIATIVVEREGQETTIRVPQWGDDATQDFTGTWVRVQEPDGSGSYGSAYAEWLDMHERVPGTTDRWRKVATVDAYQAKGGEQIRTVLASGKEEVARTAKPGQWIVRQKNGEVQIIDDAKFRRLYLADEPVSIPATEFAEITVERRVFEAYRQLATKAKGEVGGAKAVALADLRDALADIPRADLDAALKRLALQDGVTVAPVQNLKSISAKFGADPRLMEASVRIGGEENHLIAISSTAKPRELPIVAAPKQVVEGPPLPPLREARAAFTRVSRESAKGRNALNAVPLRKTQPGDEHIFEGFDALPAADRKRIQQSLVQYERSGSTPINSYLRTGKVRTDVPFAPTEAELKAMIADFRQAFDASKLQESVTVYRGLETGQGVFGPRADWPDDLSGFEWTEGGFFSTSADKRVAESFGEVQLRIVVPEGNPALVLSGMGREFESEILLPPGMRFRVVKDRGVVGGKRLLDVEVVPAEAGTARVTTNAAADQFDSPGRAAANSDLERRVKTGVVEGSETRPGYGAVADTRRVRLEDGSFAYRKTVKAGEQTTLDDEYLSTLVGQAVGAPVPGVYRANGRTLFLEEVRGDVGSAARLTEADLAQSADARLIGLMDALVGNGDRKLTSRNFVRTADGRIVAIDNAPATRVHLGGGKFGANVPKDHLGTPLPAQGARGGNSFAERFIDAGPEGRGARAKIGSEATRKDLRPDDGRVDVWAENDLRPEEVAAIRARLETLRPEFRALRREDWLDYIEGRLDAIAAKSRYATKAAKAAAEVTPEQQIRNLLAGKGTAPRIPASGPLADGYAGATLDELRVLAEGRYGHLGKIAPKASREQLLAALRSEMDLTDLNVMKREAARLLQLRVERGQALADILAEAAEQTFKRATPEAMRRSIEAIARQVTSARTPVPPAFLQGVLKAAQAGDRAKVEAALRRLGQKYKIRLDGMAGDVTRAREGMEAATGGGIRTVTEVTPDFETRAASAVSGESVEGLVPINRNSEIVRNNPTFARAFDTMTGTGFEDINGMLRGNRRLGIVDRRRREGQVSIIDSLMDDSALTSDAVVWRGLETGRGVFGDRLGSDLTGFEWTEAGYQSTTWKRRTAELFATTSETSPGVLIRLITPAGTKTLHLFGGEGELLLQRGLRMRVVRDHGVTTLHPRPGVVHVGEIDAPHDVRLLDVEIVPAGTAGTAAKVTVPVEVRIIRPGATIELPTGETRLRNAVVREVDAQEKARIRQEVIDEVRKRAEVLTEVNELVANGASKSVIRERLDIRLKRVGLDTDPDLKAFTRAVESGDPAKIAKASQAVAKKLNLSQVDEAGALSVFDPKRFQAIAGERITQGAQVRIVRPGFEYTLNGEKITLAKPVVEALSDAEVAQIRQQAVDTAGALVNLVTEAVGGPAQRRIAIEAAQLPDDVKSVLLAASRVSPAKLKTTLTAQMKKRGVTVGKAPKTPVKFDPKTMEVKGGAKLPVGTKVRVVEPEVTMVHQGETVVVRKAVVEPPMPTFRSSTAPDLKALVSGSKDPEPAIRRAIEGEYTGGIKAKVDLVDHNGGPRGYITVEGTLRDARGRHVGEFERSFRRNADGTWEAHHELLRLDEKLQGSGFATDFNANMIDWYRRSGFDVVTLDANIDVGAYAWATKGFDFEDDIARQRWLRVFGEGRRLQLAGQKSGLSSGLTSVEFERQFPGWTQAEYKAQLPLLDAVFARIKAGEQVSAYEISQIGRKSGQGKNDWWIGKAILFDTSWSGVMPI